MHENQFEELKLTGRLPSPTSVGLAILQQTRGEDASLDEVVRTLQGDPTLTGRVLELANSAAVGALEPARTARDAAARLGLRAVRGVALGFTLVSGNRTGTCEAFDYEGFWAGSLAMAIAAEVLAPLPGVVAPGEAFTCALIADIGRLAFASIHPEGYATVLRSAAGSEDALLELERQAFGADHRQLGAAMLHDWQLSEAFSAAVLAEQVPEIESDPGVRTLAELLRASRLLADLLLGKRDAEASLETLREYTKLDPEAFALLRKGVEARWREWAQRLQIATPAAPAAPATAGAAAAREPDPGGLRVVVVEAEPLTRKLATVHLVREGHQVLTAENAERGLELALRSQAQVLVTAWGLPGLSGLELVRSLRSSEEGRRLHVILLTSRDEDQRVVEAFDAGVDEFLAKPFNPRILLARVRAAQRVIDLYRQVERDQRERERQLAQLSVLTRKLKVAALTDPLTELPNRRFAMERLQAEVRGALAESRPMSVVVIDIDRFKSVNDTHGHDAGDAVLKETARLLRRSVRRGDDVCRLGGEEFVVICPGANLAAATASAERLRAAVAANEVRWGDFSRAVTISLGVAELDPARPEVHQLLKTADLRVYAAKTGGRDRVVAADPALATPSAA